MGPTFWPNQIKNPFSISKVKPSDVPFLYVSDLGGTPVKTYRLNAQMQDLQNRYL